MKEVDRTTNILVSLLGDLYNPPRSFREGEWEKIAVIPKRNTNDSRLSPNKNVEIYEKRINNIISFRIICGNFSIDTGSGSGIIELVIQMATALASNMMEVYYSGDAEGR